jgi:lactam utilization protein B
VPNIATSTLYGLTSRPDRCGFGRRNLSFHQELGAHVLHPYKNC